RDILRRDTGSDRMREITGAIQQGARAFLRRQYKTIAIIAAALAILFAVALGAQKGLLAGFETAGAFALGATFSALSGYIGMHIAIRSNVRSAAGSLKSFNDALVIALRGGAVSGLSIVSMSLAGVALLYYGYGALGSAINPTTFNDCITAGYTIALCTAKATEDSLILSILGFGFGPSIVGVFVVRAREDEAPMSALNRGYIVASVLAAILFGVAAWAMLQPSTPTASGGLTWAYYWVCGIAGMVTAVVYVWVTQYYTEARYRPVRDIAKASETGPATNIISGFAVGPEATAIPAVVVSIAILFSFWIGASTGIPGGGIYGTAIATMGMLATAAYILAMDTFGPIVDNGAGIIEMAGMSEAARRNMDKLDAAGNTTKALTKGYA